MRYCDTVAEYERAKSEGIVTDDVLVIVLKDKLIKFKGETLEFGSGGGIDPELLEAYMPISRDFSDDFNNDFTR